MSEYQTNSINYYPTAKGEQQRKGVQTSFHSQLRTTWIKNHQKQTKKKIHGVQLFTQTWAFTVQSTTLLFQLVRAH